MPLQPLGMSRSWAWPVVGCAICLSGCVRPQTTEDRLVARAEQAVAELDRLQPRLAKAGTPDADGLAEQLAAVRTGLHALPTAPPPATVPEAVPEKPPVTAAVRCPDAGCWRLGTQLEVGLWRLVLRGGGDEIHDTGPVAVGLAVGLERSLPVDHALEWSWGGELVGTLQDRSEGQSVALLGVRPFVRAALAVSDSFALTARPLVEVGQASVQLGSAPGGVLDRADVYAAVGLRAGGRWRFAGGDLTGELGWRQIWFNASAGSIDYRVEIGSPELAVGWSGRF